MIQSKKILITDKVHELLIRRLKAHGFSVDYQPRLVYQSVQQCIHDYSGLIINSKVICDRTFLDAASHLDFIGRLGSGLDIIDLDYAAKVGIEIISSPEGNANAVGEHVLGMLFSLLHKINVAHWDVRNLRWNREENRGIELKGKTVGIIGFGHTGPAFAEKLSCLGVNILVHDKYRVIQKHEFPHVTTVSLSQIQTEADIISIHLPLTHETRGMIDSDFMNDMKTGAILINSSRGAIVKSTALIAALQSGQIYGACLDVLENEKPDKWTKDEQELYAYLLHSDRVIITPHIAGWTSQSLQQIALTLLTKIQKFYNL